MGAPDQSRDDAAFNPTREEISMTAIAHVIVDLTVVDPKNGGPTDPNAVTFSFGNGANTTPNVHVDQAGNIELIDVKKEGVNLIFELNKKTLAWDSGRYTVTFKPKSGVFREALLIAGPQNGNQKAKWSYSDREFDSFDIKTYLQNDLLTVNMANKYVGPSGLVTYDYGLSVAVYKDTTHITSLYHDPQIRNGGGNNLRSNPDFWAQLIAGGAVVLVLAALILRWRKISRAKS